MLGPDGALWFTEQALGRIGRISTTGVLQEFAIPNTSGVAQGEYGSPAPRFITAGPDGALWFTDGGDESIGRITTDGQISEYPIGTHDAVLAAGNRQPGRGAVVRRGRARRARERRPERVAGAAAARRVEPPARRLPAAALSPPPELAGPARGAIGHRASGRRRLADPRRGATARLAQLHTAQTAEDVSATGA